MPYEMPTPCRSTTAHGRHQHTAVFNTGHLDMAVRHMLPVVVEPGMWCAGYVPGDPNQPVMEWVRETDEYGQPVWRWVARDETSLVTAQTVTLSVPA